MVPIVVLPLPHLHYSLYLSIVPEVVPVLVPIVVLALLGNGSTQ